MGIIVCPYHGRRLILHMCAHLKEMEGSLLEHKVTFDLLDESKVTYTAYLCPDCCDQIQVNTHELQPGDRFDELENLQDVYVCRECMKLRLE